jgi:hypothetical protein
MQRISLTLVFLFSMTATFAVAQQPRDSHLMEDGAGVLFSRSTFAHGYRHGYEAGYHLGNIDANMGRRQKANVRARRGVSSGYRAVFGPKHSFESGFRSGLQAGYSDGYAGRTFRAVTELRSLANSLGTQTAADPANIYFDQGVHAGYDQGIRTASPPHSASHFDLGQINCPETPVASSHPDFCEGYRLGFILGQTDAGILGPEHGLLEASR